MGRPISVSNGVRGGHWRIEYEGDEDNIWSYRFIGNATWRGAKRVVKTAPELQRSAIDDLREPEFRSLLKYVSRKQVLRRLSDGPVFDPIVNRVYRDYRGDEHIDVLNTLKVNEMEKRLEIEE